jgi:hypothetical protein
MNGLTTRLRKRLTFANLTSITALFIALGGTSYAAISVGSAQIRTNAVGKSEIRTGAVGKSEARSNSIGRSEIATGGVAKSEIADGSVGTEEIADGSVEAADLSTAAKTAFSLGRANVSATGANAGGNAKAISHTGPGVYVVEFDHDVSACTYGATLAAVKNGTTVEPAPNGRVTVAPGDAATKVQVSTFDATGATPADASFHLLVAC